MGGVDGYAWVNKAFRQAYAAGLTFLRITRLINGSLRNNANYNRGSGRAAEAVAVCGYMRMRSADKSGVEHSRAGRGLQ